MDKKTKMKTTKDVQHTPDPKLIEKTLELLRESPFDLSPQHLKQRLKKFTTSAGKANCVVLEMINGAWPMSADKRYFLGGKSEDMEMVVRGARQRENYTLVDKNNRAWGSEEFGYFGEYGKYPAASWLPGDKVIIRRLSIGFYCKELLSRQTRWVCQLVSSSKRTPGEVEVLPISPFTPTPMKLLLRDGMTANKLRGKAFEVELNKPNAQQAPFLTRFVRMVGERFDPLGEMAIAQAEYNLPVEFPEATLNEAESLGEEVDAKSLKKRVDLRDIPFVTIDGEDARDFDDAVYATREGDGWRLLVAIADVSHYVKPGSALDAEAQKRGTSVYFPATVVPMLPEALSNGLCSLNPEVDRLTMVCDAVLNAQGEVTAYQFYPAVIHSHARLTYTLVWDALQGEKAARAKLGDRLDDIECLYALSKARLVLRAARHALDFDTTETKAILDDQGHITGFEERRINDANRLIEECMLIANVCAAEFVLKSKRETLFRVHDKPSADKIDALNSLLTTFKVGKVDDSPESLCEAINNTKDKPFLQTQILRSMVRACYSPDNVGHFGLQFEAYAHFTSPIRRYPDLLLHRTIKGILSRRRYVPEIVIDPTELLDESHIGQDLRKQREAQGAQNVSKKAKPAANKDHAVWERLGTMCSATERRADMVTRDVMSFLKCDYFLRLTKSNPKRSFTAVITGVIPAGIFVQVDELMVEGFVHVSNLGWGYFDFDASRQLFYSYDEMLSYQVGDRVKVERPDVELESRHITFMQCRQLEHKNWERALEQMEKEYGRSFKRKRR
ncbi:MAG: VacB/RNase II family 3'-5' exoribonuclease [Sutterella wadsworthensis]|nr:VacB/RNase II family 3'-5' exoribonuclease [Sutterella wadsworthensis]